MKKLVSRFMAVLMAMTMILSMSMTAFAADAPKGTLTVNNTVAGKTLDLYQIFTATKDGDNVAYTLNSAYEGFFKTKVANGSSLSDEALSEAAYTKALAIEKGKDYVTLVTCTPYAINTHRLLVRGKRIPYKEAKKKEEANAKKNIPIYIILLIGGIIAILFIYAAIRIKEVRRSKRRKKGKSYGKKK